MTVCVVSPFPPEISGIGQYGWNIVQGFAHYNTVEPIRVLTSGQSHDGNRGVWSVWQRNNLHAAPRLLAAIRACRPRVVWFNLGFTVFGDSRPVNFLGLLTPMLARRAGFPVVVTLHELYEATQPTLLGERNGHLTRLGARVATHMILQTDAVCVTLQHYAHHLRAAYRAQHVHHLPHGAFVNPELLPPPLGPHEILILATFAPYKGLPILLKAITQVRKTFPEVVLTVAGSDHPRFPGYLGEIRAQVQDARYIRWQTALSEAQLREAFARASVVVLPYLATTGASSVLHRAAAFGRPVVASDLPDLRAVATEENLRLDFVPPGDPAALAQAIVRILANPIRSAAVAHHNLDMMQTMSLEHTCQRYWALFEHVARVQ